MGSVAVRNMRMLMSDIFVVILDPVVGKVMGLFELQLGMIYAMIEYERTCL